MDIINKKLNDLEKKIQSGNFLKGEEISKNWGGADVIISKEMTEEIKNWCNDKTEIISFQNTIPKRRVVVTKYSKELIWLFNQLGDIFSEKIDYISKYDFFGSLAQEAIKFLKKNPENIYPEQFLIKVLNSVKIKNLPANIELPFFAYGLFKPGQLCYFRIKDLVKEIKDGKVEAFLKERDGIPLLVKNANFNVKGKLIIFKRGEEINAYKRIIEIEPDEVYKWDVITVNNSWEANVLIGKKVSKGSADLEHFEEWDGSKDPYFTHALVEIQEILKYNSAFDNKYKSLFNLQMAYSLLWSALERYAGLKYHFGERVTEKVYQIANEDCFIKNLRKQVKENRTICSTTNLKEYTLDPDDPKNSIKYYYQVRSNSIHRGKSVYRDFDTVKSSLSELLTIFQELIKESFKIQ